MLQVATTGSKRGHVTTTGQLRLREATQHDRGPLWEFVSGSGLEAEGVLEAGTRFWLIEDSGGQIAASTGIEYGQDAVLFRSTAVHPAYRHQGIALSLYELRFAVALAEGYRAAYGFCDSREFMLRTGWHVVPIAELVGALPDSFQVAHFARIGWLPTEHAYRRDLANRWDELR